MNCCGVLASPISKKIIVAVTGLALSLFLVAHLSGNLLLFAGSEAFDAYAEKLQSLGALLWVARLGLIAMAVLHIYFTILVTRENRLARPVGYQVKKSVRASFASRTMIFSGLLLLTFIVYHLAHYTFRVTNPEVDALTSKYEMVVKSFQNPAISGFYILAMLSLAFHTYHGVSSFFRTTGLFHPLYRKIFDRVGLVFAVLIAGGFSSLPIFVLLGCIQ